MNVKIANALFGYFETLYYINQKLIKLCGVDVTNCFETSEYEILDIIQNIPRIIPYCWNYEKKQLEYKKSNGLLEFSDNISYLKSEYDEILSNNYNFLNDIRLIRNKYQHKMHDINHKSSGSGSMNLFDFSFRS